MFPFPLGCKNDLSLLRFTNKDKKGNDNLGILCHGRIVTLPAMMCSCCLHTVITNVQEAHIFLSYVLSSSLNCASSVQVKLRRRTKGVWEVVSIQDADETLSVLTSLKQVDSVMMCFYTVTLVVWFCWT